MSSSLFRYPGAVKPDRPRNRYALPLSVNLHEMREIRIDYVLVDVLTNPEYIAPCRVVSVLFDGRVIRRI